MCMLLQGCMGGSQMFYPLLQPRFKAWSCATPHCCNAMPVMLLGFKTLPMERCASCCDFSRDVPVSVCGDHISQVHLLLQTVTVQESDATSLTSADRTSCLPNFLRFCPSSSTSSSGQQCPTIAFDRPYGVYPFLTSQVSEAQL